MPGGHSYAPGFSGWTSPRQAANRMRRGNKSPGEVRCSGDGMIASYYTIERVW